MRTAIAYKRKSFFKKFNKTENWEWFHQVLHRLFEAPTVPITRLIQEKIISDLEARGDEASAKQAAHQSFGHRLGQLCAEPDPGQRARQQRGQQGPVDMAQRGMADACDQRQGHRVSDVGAHQSMCRQARVEQQDQRGAQCAGTDRRQRDQHPEQDARGYRQRGLALFGQPALKLEAQRMPGLAVGHGHGGEQQRD